MIHTLMHTAIKLTERYWCC